MAFLPGSIFFNKIIILQSLDEDDRKTGTELHDDTVSRATWKDPNLQAQIIQITTLSELFETLNKINQDVIQKEILPFIHFETHGTQDGLSLASGESVKWNDMLPLIAAININTDNNLFISVAACWGGKIQFLIKVNQPCPFRGFIGPMDKIYERDILSSFTVFFEELLMTDDFEKAIARLNANNTFGVEFHHFNSEAFFDLFYSNYEKAFNDKTGEHMQLRNSIVDRLWEENPSSILFESKEGLTEFVISKREALLAHLKKMESVFLHRKSFDSEVARKLNSGT
jgi:hypothetical protein